ncbi:D-ribitol-5-phosphate cytidylyltransferase [Engraulis encrasicolus]|uniref:D-ribitol-5-phosphate cytidylyltransferase n=1 Tax=Engraulis encrasicolus TaxID=184585 RepID=UPI002FD042B7
MEEPTSTSEGFPPQMPSTTADSLAVNSQRYPIVNYPVSVVLPAAGSGERTGLRTPKQFCSILGRPLISYTIHAFERILWIDTIVVVVPKESHCLMEDIILKYNHTKVKIVDGGSTRHRSIFNGLRAFSEQGTGFNLQKPEVVIIHDAVRPFLEEDFLHKITVCAKDHGVCGAIRPLVSTVVAATTEGKLDHTLERARYRASEMPQGFIYDIIYEAYQKCSEAEFEFGTECLDLALRHCGVSAKLMEGPPTLWKVTYSQDVVSAEAIIKESLSQYAYIIAGQCMETQHLSNLMKNGLTEAGMVVDVVPSTEKIRNLSTSRNFIKLSMCWPNLAEIKEMTSGSEDTKDFALYPVIICWVYLNVSDCVSTQSENDEAPNVMTLAEDVQNRNILLYCVQVCYNKPCTLWERRVKKVCEITAGLIRQRSSSLIGQILQA